MGGDCNPHDTGKGEAGHRQPATLTDVPSHRSVPKPPSSGSKQHHQRVAPAAADGARRSGPECQTPGMPMEQA